MTIENVCFYLQNYTASHSWYIVWTPDVT